MDTLGQANVCRELYWEEKTTEQRVDKLAEAVEVLAHRVVALEDENALLRQHSHLDGSLVVPYQPNRPEQPWYKWHILGRQPR